MGLSRIDEHKQKLARESKERKAKAEERRIAAWNKRKAMTFKQALEDGAFFGVECCMSCGQEQGRLYFQVEGMYAGNHYCRKCAIKALKSEYF